MSIDKSHLKFVEAVNELNRQSNAELNHGPGFDTPEKRREFQEFFDKKVEAVNAAYSQLKEKLK